MHGGEGVEHKDSANCDCGHNAKDCMGGLDNGKPVDSMAGIDVANRMENIDGMENGEYMKKTGQIANKCHNEVRNSMDKRDHEHVNGHENETKCLNCGKYGVVCGMNCTNNGSPASVALLPPSPNLQKDNLPVGYLPSPMLSKDTPQGCREGQCQPKAKNPVGCQDGHHHPEVEKSAEEPDHRQGREGYTQNSQKEAQEMGQHTDQEGQIQKRKHEDSNGAKRTTGNRRTAGAKVVPKDAL